VDRTKSKKDNTAYSKLLLRYNIIFCTSFFLDFQLTYIQGDRGSCIVYYYIFIKFITYERPVSCHVGPCHHGMARPRIVDERYGTRNGG